jgi:hypothetical protein
MASTIIGMDRARGSAVGSARSTHRRDETRSDHMAHNALVIGWNRAQAGREKQTVEHFQEFLGYLGKQQAAGNIASFTPVFMDPHGGDLNGFVLVQGETAGIRKMIDDDVWQDHVIRGATHMQGFGVIRAAVGSEIENRMKRFMKFI